MTERRTHFFVLFFLCFLSFFQFQYHRFGLELALYEDVICFMKERAYVSTDWDYFWHMLSLDRVRHDCLNTYYLFRPGFSAVTTAVDIFFRGNFQIPGIATIFLHGITAFLLFVICRVFNKFWIAFTAAIFFVFHYSGHSMIDWRYITPYLFGLWVFLFSAFQLSKNRQILASLGFFIAGLFHESFVYFLPILFCLKWVLEKTKNKNLNISTPAILIPFGAYFIWNVLDFFFHRTQNLIGNFNTLQHSLVDWLILAVKVPLYYSPIVFGWFVSGTFLPQSLIWPSHIQIPIFIVLTILFFARIKKYDLLDITLVTYLFSFSIFLAIGKLGFRGFEYLSHSNYYQYFGIFVLTILIVKHLDRFPKTLLLVIAINSIVFGYLRMQKTGMRIYENERAWVGKSLEVIRKLDSGFCYEGGGSLTFEKNLPSVLYFRKSCQQKEGIPIQGKDI